MLTEPTVIVLGAGASCPFGYPLGKELVRLVIHALGGANNSVYKTLRNLGNTDEDISRFRYSLQYSASFSVDAFLEHNREFEQMGKAAMALILKSFEKLGRAFRIFSR